MKSVIHLLILIVHQCLIEPSSGIIYTYEDVELRRIFPSEFPQDTVRKTGRTEVEHLGRYAELRDYFLHPLSKINSHFEELICSQEKGNRVCNTDENRYSSDENAYFMSEKQESKTDRRRVYCLFFLCFTDEELDKVVAAF